MQVAAAEGECTVGKQLEDGQTLYQYAIPHEDTDAQDQPSVLALGFPAGMQPKECSCPRSGHGWRAADHIITALR